MSGRIIIVDDAELVVRVLKKSLEGHGYEVRTAASGTEALELIRLQRPEVVISDLHMPDMNGHQVIEGVHGLHPDVPVILLSSDADLSAVLGAIRRGAFDYVLKSDLGNLAAAVERGVAASRRVREAGIDLTDLETRVGALSERLQELGDPAALRLLQGVRAAVVALRGGV